MSTQEANEDELQPQGTPADPLVPASDEIIFQKTNCINRFSGIFYSLIASLLFVCSTFIIKQLGVDILDAYLLRFLLQTIATLIFALYKNYTILGGTAQQVSLQILCCATGGAGFILFFTAIRYIELSDANTLGYTRVVWTMVLSVIVYRERPSIGTIIALPLTLLGVIFVTQPSVFFGSHQLVTTDSTNNKYQILGFIMAFTVALTSAVNILLFKQLISTSRDIKPSVLSLQFSFVVLILLILNQLYKIFYLHTATTLAVILSWQYLLSSFVCIISMLGTILTQKAIKREHPAVFSLLGSADIIYALILQNIFTTIRSNLYALLGSGLVISSVVVLGISRILNERHAQEKQKNGKELC